MQDENVIIVLIHRFPCSLMCGDCIAQFIVRVCETKISICNWWELEEFKTTCKLVFNHFWKPSVSSLYFLYKENQKTPLHLIVSHSEQKGNISVLKYAFLIQIGLIIFLFLPFKLFISSWSLWISNSTHPDESSRCKVPKRVKVLNTVIEFDRKRE